MIRGPFGSSGGMSFGAVIHDGGGGSATVASTVDCDLADSSIEQQTGVRGQESGYE